MKKRSISRRRFLGAASAAAFAGPMIVRPCLVGAAADGSVAPSNRITMGFIGVGKQGHGHLSTLVKRSDINVLGVADVQENKREEAKATIDKTTEKSGGATGPATSGKDVQYYNDYRELISRADVDAVLIASPDHWHANMAIEACRRGKDVYCEKPLTLTVREARDVVDAARRYGRVFQVGSQQRSSREFRFACEMVRSGRIGQLKTVNVSVGGPSKECDLPPEPVRKGVDWDAWLGPAPWRPFHSILCPGPEFTGFPNWRSYRDYSGGGMTDFGAHHFDIAQWGMGTDDTGPVEILPPDGKERKHLTYKYASGIEMYHGDGGKGITFHGTDGKIEVGRGFLETTPAGIMRRETLPNEVHLYNSPGHHDDWIRCIRARRDPICPAEIGARSVSVCHIGNICYWLNRPLKWNPAAEEFVGDAEANRWLDRPKRAPYIA